MTAETENLHWLDRLLWIWYGDVVLRQATVDLLQSPTMRVCMMLEGGFCIEMASVGGDRCSDGIMGLRTKHNYMRSKLGWVRMIHARLG